VLTQRKRSRPKKTILRGMTKNMAMILGGGGGQVFGYSNGGEQGKQRQLTLREETGQHAESWIERRGRETARKERGSQGSHVSQKTI